jgi:hypothetical protein
MEIGAYCREQGGHWQAALESGVQPSPCVRSMHLEILLVRILLALVQIAALALLGQGAVALLAGKYREKNLFYLMLRTIASPAVRFVRLITPKVIIDAHVPFLTFFMLFWLWIALALTKRYLCAMQGLAC